MNFFTHISISKILYRNLKNEMKLNKIYFIYGNLKPDLSSKCLQKPHTLENYLINVCDSAKKLMNGKTSIEEYSLKLGEICHYVCDFFCEYHINEEIFNNLNDHFLYELKLHFKLCKMLFLKKINIKVGIREERKDIASMILDMRKEYFSNPAAMTKDIAYALSTSIWVCESMSCFLVTFSELVSDDEMNAYSTLHLAGGQ